LYPENVKGIFMLALLALSVIGCRGPGGPVERAGRSVDNAVYDVGTGVKKAGQKIQQVAE
jgi:predicted small secreted protein